MRPRQGDIWVVDFGGPSGRRPAFVLTRTRAIPKLTSVTVAPITRTERQADTIVPIGPGYGLQDRSYIMLDNITTVDKKYLDYQVGSVDYAMLRQVFEAIRAAFAMPRPKP